MYFAALLARTEDGWEASDTELDDVESLSDLTELARGAAVDEDTVLVYIEQEEAWFGLVRVDGEDDPRTYVSDAAAAARSSYGAMLTDELTEHNAEADLDQLVDLDGTEDGEPDAEDDDDAPDVAGEALPAGPLGDPEVLADLGISTKELRALGDDALSEIADVLGCGEVLEAVR